MSQHHHDLFENRKQFQLERMILFSDAVFAIAITLLVIEIRIPEIGRQATYLDQHMNEPKAEFFIPTAAKYFVQSGSGVMKVIPTSAKWFGVTYKEDAPGVQANINALVNAGIYPENLWA